MRVTLTTMLAFIYAYSLEAQVVISEVYANPPGVARERGREWFEVYNAGSTSVDLAGAQVRRLDGAKLEEAWRVQLPAATRMLKPQQYGLIAQQRDLGVGVCLDVPLIVVVDPVFRFKRSGLQTLCIKTSDGQEDCAPYSNSTTFPEGHSRYNLAPTTYANDDIKWWQVEDCAMSEQSFASPGMQGGFCHRETSVLQHLMSCDTLQGPREPELSPVEAKSEMSPGTPPRVVSFIVEALSEGNHRIAYEVVDGDIDDALSVSIYYAECADSSCETLIAERVPLDLDGRGEVLWNTRDLAPGNYKVFVVALDRFGNNTVQVASTSIKTAEPILPINQVEAFDVRVVQQKNKPSFLISWRTTAGALGNVTLLAKASPGSEEEAIWAGLPSSSSLQHVLWTPEHSAATYEIRALWIHEQGQASSLPIRVRVQQENLRCACLRSTRSLSFEGLVWLVLFGFLYGRLRAGAGTLRRLGPCD
jgi:hypothetical protein